MYWLVNTLPSALCRGQSCIICYPKWLFISQPAPLNKTRVLFLARRWLSFFCWHFWDVHLARTSSDFSKYLSVTQALVALWAQRGQTRRHLWIKWLAEFPCMCFWLSALWLVAMPTLSCQKQLTSLSPTGLCRMQVYLPIRMSSACENSGR